MDCFTNVSLVTLVNHYICLWQHLTVGCKVSLLAWRLAVLVLAELSYRMGQIKRGQLIFLLVTSERIYKIK